MSKTEKLRKFRHDVALLKRKGLVTDVDARTVKPSGKWNKILDKFDAVLSGKATAVKISAAGFKEYKSLGKPYEVAAPRGLPRRVVIPHDAVEKVVVTHGKVRVLNPAGITRTIIPVKYHDLEQYLTDVKGSGKNLNKTLKKNEYFAFRFYGNRSHKVFPSMQALIKSLQHYETIFDAIEEDNAELMSEQYQNLEIVKIEDPNKWRAPQPTRAPFRREDSVDRYKQRMKRLGRSSQWKQEEYRRQLAERQADWRKRLKGSAKEKYKREQQKRNKKRKPGHS